MPKGTKVLLVDDDKMLIDMYKERLELAGYQVEISRNGEEGLAKVHEVKPDLVLMDIMMPKINGYEALASIKSDPATKDIPVIILSALMRDLNKSKAVESGADDYIIKSEAMPADVIKKIEAVLKKYGKTAPEAKMATPEPPKEGSAKVEAEAIPQVQFEPAQPAAAPAAEATPAPVGPPPLTEPIAVPNAIPQAPVQPAAVEAHQAVSEAVPKHPSPVTVALLVLIVLLIIASDIFFYLSYLANR